MPTQAAGSDANVRQCLCIAPSLWPEGRFGRITDNSTSFVLFSRRWWRGITHRQRVPQDASSSSGSLLCSHLANPLFLPGVKLGSLCRLWPCVFPIHQPVGPFEIKVRSCHCPHVLREGDKVFSVPSGLKLASSTFSLPSPGPSFFKGPWHCREYSLGPFRRNLPSPPHTHTLGCRIFSHCNQNTNRNKWGEERRGDGRGCVGLGRTRSRDLFHEADRI